MQTLHENQNPSGLGPYGSNIEFLIDLMGVIDHKLANRIACQANSSDAIDQLRGLVITKRHVDDLLDSRPSSELDSINTTSEDLITDQVVSSRLAATSPSLPITVLQRLFGLNSTETTCIELCLCREIDPKYETLFAFIHDDVTRKGASVQLVIDLACRSFDEKLAARTMFRDSSALFRHGLIEHTRCGESTSLIKSEIKLNERITEFLLGNHCLAAELENSCQLISTPIIEGGETVDVPEHIRDVINRAQLKNPESRSLIMHLTGDARTGLVWEATRGLELPVLCCPSKELLGQPRGFLGKLCREAALQPAVLLLTNFELIQHSDDHSLVKNLLNEIQTYCRLTMLTSKSGWFPPQIDSSTTAFVSIELPKFDARERHFALCQLTGQQDQNPETRQLSHQFKFSREDIHRAANHAIDQKLLQESPNRTPGIATSSQLRRSCQAISKQNLELGNLARRIDSVGTWDRLVLAEESKAHLREICAQSKQRHVVFEEWGFHDKLSYGKGISVLFAGMSGTGKTLAAEVLANELEMDLFKIDLSQVVNKYIGETEKNLGRIFDSAAKANVILFFDEADALFGKRSEVRDSHDRYSNLEVSYLLQKMEEFDGISILATNLRKNMDEAFLRRLQAIVEFPFPDAEQREKIWRSLLPEETPLADDVDFATLANRVRLAGGNIKNIALSAACLAADDDGVLNMSHLIRSAKREYRKLGHDLEFNFVSPMEAVA